jgi:hypothetical protein
MTTYSNKKEIFSELHDYIYLKDNYKHINSAKISSFKNPLLIETIKTLRIIVLDSLESFLFYVNYDHFLIFNFNGEYYFCDTELVPDLGIYSMLKIIDYSIYFRKEKIEKINKI